MYCLGKFILNISFSSITLFTEDANRRLHKIMSALGCENLEDREKNVNNRMTEIENTSNLLLCINETSFITLL